MEKIQINASRKYEMLIGRDLLTNAGKYISEVIEPGKVCIVTDDVVSGIYKDTVFNSLVAAGFEVYVFVFEHGEKSKNITTVSSILEYMAENDFTRSDAIAALGGGITGDVAGFAASVFLRGIRFVQLPTTFLAAVDSSVGGKTGVNLKGGKNLAGAFWQPSLVLCDCNTFSTLPYEIFLDGVAEAIKYGAIINRELFDTLMLHNHDLFPSSEASQKDIENNVSSDVLIEIVNQCVTIKRDIVMEDERDTGVRQLLNFGHTIGHAVEKCSNYAITHGHAVAIGMFIVSKASYKLGLCKMDCSLEIENMLNKFNFPVACPFTAAELTQVALKDKKRAGKSITLVLPDYIGHCYLKKINIEDLETFISAGL
ncbi:3-dehydroquinate synthase [Aminipila terrae]|uniref:3-dehydroquinate synthase n=1 Tax=Aminipila terrae TaxID=2697030 RepID=A0A6P1MGT0_9FIRM|nr:3-dehydroquinate synthase [Aminipila terrae]QHI73929.1 3-dehydroquinate synthase [Aminipila terrae]